MLKKIDIEAINVNLSDTLIDYGIPSIFSFHGLTKNLELKLKKEGYKISIDYFLPFFKKINPSEGRQKLATDLLATGLINNFKGYIKATLLIEINGEYNERIDKDIYIFIKQMRIAGGNIIRANVKDISNIDKIRIKGFYPDLSLKEEKNDIFKTIVKNSLFYQKGVKNVCRIGELILTELDKNKSNYGYNINISTAIFKEIEFKKQKNLNIKEFFDKNKLSLIKQKNEIILNKGEIK